MSRIEIRYQHGQWMRLAGWLAFFSLLAVASVVLILWAPREAIWGNSPLVPRIGGALGFVGSSYLAASMVWYLTRRGPIVVMDVEGFVTQSYPWRRRGASWDEVKKLRVLPERRMVVVELQSGSSVKVATPSLEDGWNEDRIVAEMNRLSGGRVGL